MKVKHTQNGNVKITLTLEQAQRLRSILIDADILRSKSCISEPTKQAGDELNEALLDADISYEF